MRSAATALLIPTIAAAIALTGCSAPEPAPTVTVTVTATPEALPSPSPTPTEEGPLALGTAAPTDGATMNVHSVNQDPAPEPAPQPQSATDKWVSADVEICNTSGAAFDFSAATWSLADTENRAFGQSSLGYNQFPQPEYAFGSRTLDAGACHRGWITFVVNESSTLVSVDYRNTIGEGASWSVS